MQQVDELALEGHAMVEVVRSTMLTATGLTTIITVQMARSAASCATLAMAVTLLSFPVMILMMSTAMNSIGRVMGMPDRVFMIASAIFDFGSSVAYFARRRLAGRNWNKNVCGETQIFVLFRGLPYFGWFVLAASIWRGVTYILCVWQAMGLGFSRQLQPLKTFQYVLVTLPWLAGLVELGIKVNGITAMEWINFSFKSSGQLAILVAGVLSCVHSTLTAWDAHLKLAAAKRQTVPAVGP